jgi:hypothetical protein
VAAAAADGAALSPLLTSGNVKRQKVSMMSLGCPKNVVDGAHAGGAACAFCAVLQRTRASPGAAAGHACSTALQAVQRGAFQLAEPLRRWRRAVAPQTLALMSRLALVRCRRGDAG